MKGKAAGLNTSSSEEEAVGEAYFWGGLQFQDCYCGFRVSLLSPAKGESDIEAARG